MKTFSITELASEEFIKSVFRKYGWNLEKLKGKVHPHEDFFLISEKYPIFAVADGVTLIQFLAEKKEYPIPSPAGDVARIFCEELVKSAEARYKSFKDSDIKEIFRKANAAVGEYNREHGRAKETVDYWNTDFYAATAAFAVIKNDIVYWGSICDSYIMRFSSDGAIIFQSPDCNAKAEAEPPRFTGDVNDRKEKAQYIWSIKRNGIDENGKLVGYGVATGEETANRYLNFGSFRVLKGDLILVLTDGFENYVQLPEFISLFTKWPDDIKLRFVEFTAAKTKENPDKFGHERSLIVVPCSSVGLGQS